MSESVPESILVVDDHRMFGESLRFLIGNTYPSARFQHVTDTEAALEQLSRPPLPDIILLDLKLPGTSGQTFLEQLRELEIWVPVLIVSASRSMMDAKNAIQNGALGFVSKEAASEDLITAIETVINGGIYNYFERRPNPDAEDGNSLTPRQLDVLHMLAEGHANKNIADRLGISEHTVKAHLHEIFRVLSVRNRTACVKEAERLGLV